MTWTELFAKIAEEGPARPWKVEPIDPDDPEGPQRRTGERVSDAWCVQALVNRALRLERLTALGAPDIILASETLLIADALSWLPVPPPEALAALGRPHPEDDGDHLWPGEEPPPPDLRIVE